MGCCKKRFYNCEDHHHSRCSRKKDATSMTTTIMATANALARKNATSITTTIMVTKNALVATMIHVMRKNIIVKTDATMITA